MLKLYFSFFLMANSFLCHAEYYSYRTEINVHLTNGDSLAAFHVFYSGLTTDIQQDSSLLKQALFNSQRVDYDSVILFENVIHYQFPMETGGFSNVILVDPISVAKTDISHIKLIEITWQSALDGIQTKHVSSDTLWMAKPVIQKIEFIATCNFLVLIHDKSEEIDLLIDELNKLIEAHSKAIEEHDLDTEHSTETKLHNFTSKFNDLEIVVWSGC